MTDLKQSARNLGLKLPRLPRRLKNLLLLAASLLAGLTPLLFWLALILLWYYAPWPVSLNMTKVTLALLLLSPFTAGFFHCRWQGCRYTLGVGAWPAFWLWLGAAAAYTWLFAELPQPEKALVALAVSLLLGIAGAMLAARHIGRAAAYNKADKPINAAGEQNAEKILSRVEQPE